MDIPVIYQNEATDTGRFQEECPYYHESRRLCRASASVLVIDTLRRNRFCACDDHDRCAIFLAKTLRAERLTGFASHGDLEEK